MRVVLILMMVATMTACSTVPAKPREADYVRAGCKGRVEVTLKDGTRADCLTETHAIEYDWAHKWAEAVGQAMHYARVTGKKPGVVLILKTEADQRYVERVRPLAIENDITLWTVTSRSH